MPYRTRLAETIAQALRELEVQQKYVVRIFTGQSSDDWLAEMTPMTGGSPPFCLRFIIGDSTDWVALVDVARQQITRGIRLTRRTEFVC